MNIRTVMVPTVPMASTAAAYAAVSLPCEPWMEPKPTLPQPVNQYVAATNRREDAAEKIINAMTDGHFIFDVIMNTAFGKRTGRLDDLGRTTLSRLMAEGKVTRVRSDAPGKPFIWSLTGS